jgi:hypothetical protein
MSNPVDFPAQARLNPTRYFESPAHVVRDVRLNREQKLAILSAWEREARALAVASEENMHDGVPSRLDEVVQARIELGDEEKLNPDDTGPSAATKYAARKSKSNLGS